MHGLLQIYFFSVLPEIPEFHSDMIISKPYRHCGWRFQRERGQKRYCHALERHVESPFQFLSFKMLFCDGICRYLAIGWCDGGL